jgi:phosphatidylglycerophosphatase A
LNADRIAIKTEEGTLKVFERRAAMCIATGLCVGFSPVGPGTFGTLLAVPFIWLGAQWGVFSQIMIAGAFFALGLWAAERALKVLGKEDAPQIVVDEIAGFLVAMVGIPFTWYWLGCGFLLFRFFDIYKPFPISTLDEKVGGGRGVMLDDLAAGLFANLVMHLMVRASL